MPVHDGEITVWQSLAILEYLAEAMREARLWPEDRKARATARALGRDARRLRSTPHAYAD
jgi:glutathione S-transferase